MIPEAKQPAVARALKEAFGVTELEDIRMMTAGLSPALVFRIVLRGCPYLLRVAARASRGVHCRHDGTFPVNQTYLPKTLQQPANILDAYGEVMMTQTAPMLPVSGGNASIDFYGAAFARSCFGA